MSQLFHLLQLMVATHIDRDRKKQTQLSLQRMHPHPNGAL